MKNILLLAILVFSAHINLSQEVDVPQQTLEYFQKEFNSHNESLDILWTKNEIGYKVTFEYNDKKRSAQFDELGNFKESRIFVVEERLNPAVKEYIQSKYNEAKIIQCYEVTSNAAPERNEVEIEFNGEAITLYFRPNGDFHFKK